MKQSFLFLKMKNEKKNMVNYTSIEIYVNEHKKENSEIIRFMVSRSMVNDVLSRTLSRKTAAVIATSLQVGRVVNV